MSDMATSKPANVPEPLPYKFSLANEPETKLDRWLAWASEYISPILVKETRQAFKSRQFFITFFLLLFSVVIWSLLGIAMSGATYSEDEVGLNLLQGYWVILGIPLAIIIPFMSFRSLASEYENDTLQLVSITTMRPYQIVLGKLGSALLQIIVYLSALAPCICFTYLLRGVDLFQIFFGLSISFLGSIALCSVALFLAGVTKNIILRSGLSLILIVGLLFAYGGFLGLMGEVVFSGYISRDVMTSALMASSAIAFGVGFLAFTASTSQITFAADNRATMNRVAMLVLNTTIVAMYAMLMMEDGYYFWFWFVTMVIGHFWLIMGFMMIGEYPLLSPRVRRTLPDKNSFLARSFLSLLWPGPGRGYLFAICNLWGWIFVFVIVLWFGNQFFESTGRTWSLTQKERATSSMIGNGVYVSFYLSVLYLFTVLLRRRGIALTPGGSLVFGVVIVILAFVFSAILHYSLLPNYQADDYSAWQAFNWYWTSMELVQGNFRSVGVVAMTLVGISTIVFGVICLVHASKELRETKVATPDRVLEDKQEQLPSYVAPAETIDSIFEERAKERLDDQATD